MVASRSHSGYSAGGDETRKVKNLARQSMVDRAHKRQEKKGGAGVPDIAKFKSSFDSPDFAHVKIGGGYLNFQAAIQGIENGVYLG